MYEHYRTAVRIEIPVKTLSSIEKLAELYDMSRTRTILMLIEMGIKATGEDVERTTTMKEGKQKKNGVAVCLNQPLRKVL